jgi:hypothetical protein
MKKILFIIPAILFSSILFSQSCLPEGADFTTQEQIDNFQVNYPGCTEIEGSVEIEGTSITNLDGLIVITSIGGHLYISNNDFLTDISGLSSLESVAGALLISSNDVLSSLNGLENLTQAEGDVFISNNPVLTDISALENIIAENVEELWITNNSQLETCDNSFICSYLANPTGTINIKLNAPGCNNPPEVADVCGLSLFCLPDGNYNFFSQEELDNFQENYPGCTTLTGIVTITGSDITSLEGLNVVDSVDGSLKVQNNPLLTSLAGLDSITVITGSVTISGNELLSDISALNYVDTSLVNFLVISSNPLLSECDILFVCDFLGGEFGATHHNITGNNTGCQNTDEVWMECTVGVDEMPVEQVDQLIISPNPASTKITIKTPEISSKSLISIFNLSGQEVITKPVTGPATVIEIDHLPVGIYFVRMEGKYEIINEKFIKLD